MTLHLVHTSRISTLALGAALLLTTAACTKSSESSPASSAAGPVVSPDDDAESEPITDPPVPPPVTANPLKGAKLFVDPESNVMGKANSLRQTDPEKAALLDKIAKQPQGLWMGEWNKNIRRAVEHFVDRATKEGSVAVIIAYNIPHRDAAAVAEGVGASAGGLASKEKYQRWIRDVYKGVGDRPVAIVLEPDALPGITSLPPALQEERYFLFNDAVKVLRQNPKAAVYIDAGHGKWVPAKDMAERLKKAGVEHASGFSLNTSNYRTTEESVAYGKEISALVGGKHFIVDTSRNGAGPYEGAKNITEMWCNPPGRKIGRPPTTETGEPLCDGFLWLKRPGESDGECERGEPKAGVFWLEQALEYAK
jgi:endoglucanase